MVLAEKLWRGDDDVRGQRNISSFPKMTFLSSTELDDKNVIYLVR